MATAVTAVTARVAFIPPLRSTDGTNIANIVLSFANSLCAYFEERVVTMALSPSSPTHHTMILLLAIFAKLSQLPPATTSPLKRHDLVRQMLTHSDLPPLSADLLHALTDEMLLLSVQFPCFDALLCTYDIAIIHAEHLARGLEWALAGQVPCLALFPQSAQGTG